MQRGKRGEVTCRTPLAVARRRRRSAGIDMRYQIWDIRCGIPFGDDFEKCVYRFSSAGRSIGIVIIGFNKHGILFNFMRQSFVHHCHCEERSDVAIRILLGGRYKIATLQGERIAAPVCGLARNDRGNGTLQGERIAAPVCGLARNDRGNGTL